MDFIDDFIQEYRNNPCLWKAESPNYKNRSKRQEAYHKLIDVAARHGEHYNVERTKQKINNLRCAFRHQLKKYNELKSKGEKEEPYCPKRKYFESLMFLKDEETTTTKDKRTKQESVETTTPTPVIGNKNGSRLLSTETETGSVVDAVDVDKTTTPNSGASVEDPLPNIFSDICKEIQTENNNELDDETNNEEATTVNISVITDKVMHQDIEEIAITPIRKEQVFIVDNSSVSLATNNTANISSPPKQFQQQQNSKSRKRSSSFSSQHSNETTDTTPTPIKASKSDITLDLENLLSFACKNFQKNTVDHHTNFGEVVAHKLRSMDPKQAIYAEKIISDILYQGQMKYLTPSAIERCSHHLDRLHQDHK